MDILQGNGDNCTSISGNREWLGITYPLPLGISLYRYPQLLPSVEKLSTSSVDNCFAPENPPGIGKNAFIISSQMWITLLATSQSNKTSRKSNTHFYTFMNGCPQFSPIYPRFLFSTRFHRRESCSPFQGALWLFCG